MRVLRPLLASLLAAGLLVPGLAAPSSAATPIEVHEVADLSDALGAGCPADQAFLLQADITAWHTDLLAHCSFTLDLDGHALGLASVSTPGITIEDSTLAAAGRLSAPVWLTGTDATAKVNSGMLRAAGDGITPGVGADEPGTATLVVNDGSVWATSEAAAAIGGRSGIEGADGTDGINVEMYGGTVLATTLASSRSAAIGGGGAESGAAGSGGDITLLGGELTVSGGYTAFGSGHSLSGADGSDFGSLYMSGAVVRMTSGHLRIAHSTAPVYIGPGGILTGADTTPPTYAEIEGGSIENHGVIRMPAANVTGAGTAVSDHHYALTFDDNHGGPITGPLVVFATTADSGRVTWPEDPTWAGHTFDGWSTVRSGGALSTYIYPDVVLPGASTGEAAVQLRLYAQWLGGTPSAGGVTIAGRPQVGRTLVASTAKARSASPAALSWQWSRGGKAIAGATQAAYRVKPADYGKRLTATATVGTGPSASRASARTAVVGLQPLTLSVAGGSARAGQRLTFTVTHLLPGQRWSLGFGIGIPVSTGRVPAGAQTLTASPRLASTLSQFGRRHLVFETTGPRRTVQTVFTLRR